MPDLKIADDEIQKAVIATISAQILSAMKTDHRDAILTNAIATAMKSWDFQRAVQDAVCAEASRVAVELCQTDHWGAMIQQTVKDSFEKALKDLESRMEKNLFR